MEKGNRYDSAWVRSSLDQCHFLMAEKTIGADARSVIDFAIRWAPFGGASAGDVLVTFGVDRWRFVQMVRAALHPCAADSSNTRAVKRNLSDALTWAWRAIPGSSVLTALEAAPPIHR